MHGDEAVHAFKFAELWERGVYRYDPNEYHGPTLYYAAVPTVWLSGRHHFGEMREADLRLAPALIGAAMVPLLLLLSDGLGRRAGVVAALLMAVSPAFVFYSRYFIQEVPLVFFTLAAIACGWRYRQSGRIGWLVGAAAAAGLMIATKETALLTFAAAGMAALGLRIAAGGLRIGRSGHGEGAKQRSSDPQGATRNPQAVRNRVLLSLAVALGVAYVCLSGFFSHPAGPLGYLETYLFWGRRGVGETPHLQPVHYYLEMLLWNRSASEPVWTEALIVVLGAIGAIAACRRAAASPLLRFLALYTLILAGIYSFIPYKTPWLVLSFHLGLILLAGAGAVALVHAVRPWPGGALVGVLLFGGFAHLGWQARAASTDYCTSAGNPYVYAQPVPDAAELGRQVEKVAAASPEGQSLIVKVIHTDDYYWPLPWYLRRMRNVGYWTAMPPDAEVAAAPFAIVSSTYDPDEALTPRLPDSLMTGYYGLRPGVTFELWVRMEVWERYVRGLRRPTDGG